MRSIRFRMVREPLKTNDYAGSSPAFCVVWWQEGRFVTQAHLFMSVALGYRHIGVVRIQLAR